MKIKTVFVSSSFDSNVYPRGVACVECTIQTKDNEISFMFIRKAEDNTIESFIENDNLCLEMAIQKTYRLLKNVEYGDLSNMIDYQRKFSEEVEKNKVSYKQKVVEFINLMNWNLEKLAKFVHKYKNKKLSELNEKDWYQVYIQLNRYLQNNNHIEINKTNLVKDEQDQIEDELIRPEEWDEII